MIRLPKDEEWDKGKNPATRLTEMLSTLLSNSISPERKVDELEDKFGIETTEGVHKEVDNVCNYSDMIRNEGFEDGQKKGFDEGSEATILANIKTLMRKKHWSAEETMDVLDISEEKRKKYISKLKEFSKIE